MHYIQVIEIMAQKIMYPEGWLAEGNVHFLFGRYEQAIKAYDQAMALYPSNEVVKTNKAIAEYRLSHPEPAGPAPAAAPAPAATPAAAEGGFFGKVRSWLGF
jgi:tetratricopeptide (TPR) repeat protein